MAENKKSFILYVDQKSTIDMLSDEQAGKLLKHIYAYVNDENPTLESLELRLVFEPIRLQFKRDLKKWENTKDQKSVAGIMGNLKRYNPDLYEAVQSNSMRLIEAQNIAEARRSSQRDTELAVNVNDNVNVNVNVNDINISFDLFWDLYDKKVGDKTKIEKKWNKLTNQQREDIVKYIPKYIASQPDKQFRKHPETFLNQKGWEDEIILKKPNRGEITIDSFQVW